MRVVYPEIRRVCVFGVGGVGGYFGGRIAGQIRAEKVQNEKAPEHEVYFIARGEQLAAIRSRGLKLITPERTIIASPSLASDDVSSIPAPELFLLCVKSYDMEGAVAAMAPQVGERTLIIPLMNGVDIYERIRGRLAQGIVLPACLYLGTHIQSPGVIAQNGGSGAIICGPDPRHPEYAGENLKAFCARMGIVLDWREDPYPAIWEKYLFIAAFGLVSARAGKSLGEIMDNAALKEKVSAVMQEILGIARRRSVRLPEDIIEKSLEKARTFPYEARTSYQRDIEAGRPLNEGDLYGGTIIREGVRLDVATPVTQGLYRGS